MNPRNAFCMFLAEKIRPGCAKEAFKIASKEWKVLPEIQKRPYKQLYKQKRDEYSTALEKLTDEQKDDLEQGRKQTNRAKQMRKLKKELSALTADRPKHMNPYNYFLIHESKNLTGKTLIELSKMCSAKWKTMTDAQKKPYLSKVKDLSAEMQQWKNKVAEDGRDVQIRELKKQIAEMKE